MSRLLIKIGGAQLEQAAARSELAHSLAAARRAGHEVLVVHGGGNQMRAVSKRLGIADRYHDGLRITDAPTAEVALMVLGGLVNRLVVESLEQAGVRAVGLTGADGGTFTVRRHAPGGVDLGYVGQVENVDPSLVDHLASGGFVPVLATVAPLANNQQDARDQFYNVNADHAVAPLARAFAADVVLFLTDVPGVLDATRRLVPSLSPGQCERFIAEGTIHGGMLPKVDAARQAAAACPRAIVKIAPAAGTGAVIAALADAVGTRFTEQESQHGS